MTPAPAVSWDELPLRLYAVDMARVFNISLNAFYKREALGDYVFAEIRPRSGKKSWSKDRVRAAFDGQLPAIGRLKRPA